MKEIIIEGGKPLSGVIRPQGSKNAALPIIFATVITHGVSRLRGVPDIGDVRIAIKLIEELGAVVRRQADVLTVDTRSLEYKAPSIALSSSIRASSYLIGACLARFGRAALSPLGGCNFDNRPIDMHLYAAERLGASVLDDTVIADRLVGGIIEFDKPSVGATVNALLMSASAEGCTEIRGAAEEPHISALIEYLRSAGASIEYIGGNISVRGAHLGSAEARIIPDMIEAGTYLLLGPLTGGRVSVLYPAAQELESLCSVLDESGITVERSGEYLSASGEPSRPISIKTSPYPGYPTDLHPQLAPLMAKFFGGSIEETVWLGRFGYLRSLGEFGVRYTVRANSACVYPSVIRPASVCGTDLRGTAACLMAALCADGISRISEPSVILRGYENIESKLASLGASVGVK